MAAGGGRRAAGDGRNWIQVYIGVTWVVVRVVLNWSMSRIPSTFFWMFLVFWGVATGVNFHRVRRLRALGYVVALHPEGVYVRRENIDRLVRWDEASEVARNKFFFRMWDKTPLALVLTSGERIQLGDFLPTRAMRTEFVEAFEQRRRPG